MESQASPFRRKKRSPAAPRRRVQCGVFIGHQVSGGAKGTIGAGEVKATGARPGFVARQSPEGYDADQRASVLPLTTDFTQDTP